MKGLGWDSDLIFTPRQEKHLPSSSSARSLIPKPVSCCDDDGYSHCRTMNSALQQHVTATFPTHSGTSSLLQTVQKAGFSLSGLPVLNKYGHFFCRKLRMFLLVSTDALTLQEE